jgi:hypothetical protein
MDLDIPDVSGYSLLSSSALLYFVWARADSRCDELLALVALRCPTWFEPTKRRLALNNLAWLDLRQRINDLDDFDPWSKAILQAYYNGHDEEANFDQIHW